MYQAASVVMFYFDLKSCLSLYKHEEYLQSTRSLG